MNTTKSKRENTGKKNERLPKKLVAYNGIKEMILNRTYAPGSAWSRGTSAKYWISAELRSEKR